MAQDYIIAKESNENGRIAINKSVFQLIAEISMKDIEDAVPDEGTFSQPVAVKIADNHLNVEVWIKVKYGANVNATAGLVQQKIYDNVQFMTGFKPSEVTVNVTGFEI